MEQQISIDDVVRQAQVTPLPQRLAFIDESGSFGFNFTKDNVSKFYVICSVIVDSTQQEHLDKMFQTVKNNNGFGNTELKSSKIGNDHRRRRKILLELLHIEFRVVLFIANKQDFMENSPLTDFKTTFIKYLHKRFYNILYHVYPKLNIVEDEHGYKEFQRSFKEYVIMNRPTQNLFNEYDFDYIDSKDSQLVQLADFIAGTISKSYNEPTSPNYLEILKGKIIALEEFPNKLEPYWGRVNPSDVKYSPIIFTLSQKCASDFISKNIHEESFDRRLQCAFLRYLIFYVLNVDPLHFIPSVQILRNLQPLFAKRLTKDILYRRIVSQLRDDGVLLASCSKGYKIPISSDDITAYLNQTHSIVSPMLHRVEICRKLIRMATNNDYDILDDLAFCKYKRYFD